MPRLPGTRTLLTLATGALEDYRALWQDAFGDAATSLRQADLPAALRSHVLLETEQLVLDRWQQTVEQPVRRRLPRLLEDSIGTVMTSADLPQPTRVLLSQPQVQQRIAEQVGTEIVQISRTTLRAVRQVLREGWQAGQSPQMIATRLRQEIGLTPRQHQSLARLKARWQAEGKTAREITSLTRQARATALSQRALAIARTETTTAANMGAYQTLQALAQQGSLVSASTLRRYWVTTGNACPTCAAVPGMNPNGVPWDQPFQTPDGPAYYPALHVNCSCVTASAYATEG